jgi:hypothetical protein
LKFRGPPLRPTSIGDRRATFAKAYGIKVRWYCELLGGTCQELGNSLLWPFPPPLQNPQEKKKIAWKVDSDSPLSTPNTTWKKTPPPPHPQEKKGRPMMQLLVGCMKILNLKLAATTFGLD